MAGIGFHLKKLFQPDTFLDNFRAVIYSATIASGPIFFSILCLALLGIFAKSGLDPAQFEIFTVTIVYIFAFSLIATGTTQLLFSRYLSDLIFAKEFPKIAPALSSALIFTIVIQCLFGLPFIIALKASAFYRFTAFGLFITIGCIWQLMVFLSAVKKFRSIVWAFFAGVSISFILGYYLSQSYGLQGLLHGYFIGQFGIFITLLWRVLQAFHSNLRPTLALFTIMKKFPALILIGFFYNLGIWIDKIIFWYSNAGEQVEAFLHASELYDNAMYVAYLTVIPAYTYFLVKVETEFYGYFRTFFQTILNKESLGFIEDKKEDICRTVRESLLGMTKIQGLVTLLCLLYSDEILTGLHMSHLSVIIFEKALVAIFLQMLLLTLMIFMMYFDVQKELLIVALVFVASNTLLTAYSIKLGIQFYGYGYYFANFLTLILAYIFLNQHLKSLEYRTFIGQVRSS